MTDIRQRLGLDAGAPPLVALHGIDKVFPGVIANKNVSLEVFPGEIHALLGENGAGKSTLMNVLTGIYQPEAGEIHVGGYARVFTAPQDAIAAGIGMVHQHFKLVKAFTVAENVHLGWADTPARIHRSVLEQRTADLSHKLGLAVDPGATVDDLSTGEQQRVEILRVLSRDAKVLILDEPTAVLTPAEAQELFVALRAFVARGNAVIFISHKLDEVLEIADRITILRQGRKVATEWAEACTERSLAQKMVGREIVLSDMRTRTEGVAGPGAPVLTLDGVTLKGRLTDVSLQLRAGEILGVAGVAGNGQRELCQVLTGLATPDKGRVLLDGDDIAPLGPRKVAALGVGHIPEDRLGSGLAPALSVTDNTVLREYRQPPVSRGPWYMPRAARALAEKIAAIAEVMVPDFAMPVRNLSGGNQQRLVARREMRIASRVLVAAYPSRGLDVGAINTMMRYFTELRDQGVAVVLVSEELEELLNLSDRIAVMFHGQIMGVVEGEQADIDEIGLMMGGQRGPQAEVAA
ncbi:ABC transporter ATP-binding protein [Rhodobacter sp. NTK016B]|uniref:ABC transporter ATP-binding protein n=2 Tax=Bacteria TaxID=2 RepID=UPI001A8DF484|nr:ABC transporter ATP-binding protein [Rhodobacter sp. NTK016B]MBN8293669.1 ABC transporter ATP-binding protein [Rhodobacter sp. NTK016B]